MDELQESSEKLISEQLMEALAQLTTDQIRFVVKRQDVPTDKEAADSLDINVGTVYHWPDVVKDAVRLMAADGLIVARHLIRKNAAKAAMVKAEGLDSKNEKIRQDAASDMLDRVGLKEAVKVDVTSKGERLGSSAEQVGEAIAILDAARESENNESG